MNFIDYILLTKILCAYITFLIACMIIKYAHLWKIGKGIKVKLKPKLKLIKPFTRYLNI